MTTTFTPSIYQKAIFDWVKNPGQNAVVQAVAGSGKTTTIVESLSHMDGDVLFCAFNKHIANELAKRAPGHVFCSTIHSAGLSAITKAYGRPKVDDRKIRNLIKTEIHSISMRDRNMISAVDTLARLAKLTLTSPSDKVAMGNLIANYDIDIDGEDVENAIEVVHKLLVKDLAMTRVIDFADMLWIPVVNKLPMKTYDWVCVDEAQDLSAVQRELVIRIIGKSGRMVAVGDEHQSIFGFAGADTSSIPTMVDKLKAKELPLSICYRCPSSHVELAKSIVPQIEARPGAPEGSIYETQFDDLITDAQDGDMVLCRTNAPLVEVALSIIKSGRKALIRGKEIGSNLKNLVLKCDSGSLIETMKSLEDYVDSQMADLYEKDRIAQAHRMEDRLETIKALAGQASTTQGLISIIDAIFSNEFKGVICSTVHKAKGLEADNVHIYRPDLMPFPFAKKEWELEQEENLRYVALTRAKSALFFAHNEDAS